MGESELRASVPVAPRLGTLGARSVDLIRLDARAPDNERGQTESCRRSNPGLALPIRSIIR